MELFPQVHGRTQNENFIFDTRPSQFRQFQRTADQIQPKEGMVSFSNFRIGEKKKDIEVLNEVHGCMQTFLFFIFIFFFIIFFLSFFFLESVDNIFLSRTNASIRGTNNVHAENWENRVIISGIISVAKVSFVTRWHYGFLISILDAQILDES